MAGFVVDASRGGFGRCECGIRFAVDFAGRRARADCGQQSRLPFGKKEDVAFRRRADCRTDGVARDGAGRPTRRMEQYRGSLSAAGRGWRLFVDSLGPGGGSRARTGESCARRDHGSATRSSGTGNSLRLAPGDQNPPREFDGARGILVDHQCCERNRRDPASVHNAGTTSAASVSVRHTGGRGRNFGVGYPRNAACARQGRSRPHARRMLETRTVLLQSAGPGVLSRTPLRLRIHVQLRQSSVVGCAGRAHAGPADGVGRDELRTEFTSAPTTFASRRP